MQWPVRLSEVSTPPTRSISELPRARCGGVVLRAGWHRGSVGGAEMIIDGEWIVDQQQVAATHQVH
eukprot:COSAG02_NODE_65_length_42645_cov_26.951934_43_plen_66_part_00